MRNKGFYIHCPSAVPSDSLVLVEPETTSLQHQITLDWLSSMIQLQYLIAERKGDHHITGVLDRIGNHVNVMLYALGNL